jgi:hypothetical protein
MVVRGDDGWEYHIFQDEIEVLTPTPLDKALGISCSLVLFHQSTPEGSEELGCKPISLAEDHILILSSWTAKKRLMRLLCIYVE